MKDTLKIAIIGGACVAACSLPVLIAALGATGISLGLGTWFVLGIIVLAIVIGMAMQRRSAASACKADGSCGCKEGTAK